MASIEQMAPAPPSAAASLEPASVGRESVPASARAERLATSSPAWSGVSASSPPELPVGEDPELDVEDVDVPLSEPPDE